MLDEQLTVPCISALDCHEYLGCLRAHVCSACLDAADQSHYMWLCFHGVGAELQVVRHRDPGYELPPLLESVDLWLG